MPASPSVPTLFRDRWMEAPCTKCGAKMTLARIEPAKPGDDLRSFECTKCNNIDQHFVEYETSSPGVLVVRGNSAAFWNLRRNFPDEWKLCFCTALARSHARGLSWEGYDGANPTLGY